ncbi:hypothetical protein ACFSNO_33635 [Streptomyces cirratus]
MSLREVRDADGAPGGLAGVLEYATDLYDADTAALLATHLARVLRAVAEDPGQRIGDVRLMSAEEEFRLVTEYNDTATPQAPCGLVHERFAAQARRTPTASRSRTGGDPHLRRAGPPRERAGPPADRGGGGTGPGRSRS